MCPGIGFFPNLLDIICQFVGGKKEKQQQDVLCNVAFVEVFTPGRLLESGIFLPMAQKQTPVRGEASGHDINLGAARAGVQMPQCVASARRERAPAASFLSPLPGGSSGGFLFR